MNFKKLNVGIALFLVVIISCFSFITLTSESFALRDHDRDRDGIQDDLDKCPQIAENYNKFEDGDGCPDSISEEITKYEFPDSDGDGFEDRLDNCVLLPETFNDYLDFDGCPEIIPTYSDVIVDSDLDTISDSIDACPNQKETFNGFKDGDGCPDSLTPSVSESSQDKAFASQCLDEKIPVLRINSQDPICVSMDTAKRWEELGIAEIDVSSMIEELIDTVEPQKPDPQPSHEGPLSGISEMPEIMPDLIKNMTVTSQTILNSSKTVIDQDIWYPEGAAHITSKIVTIPVGGETGPHTHEYPLFAYVMTGEVTVDYGEKGEKKFVKGDALLEAINYTHNGKNTGSESTEILVVLLNEN